MIVLLAASSIYLTALQASITAPTTAFRSCLKEAGDKAKNEKVGADAVDAYLRNACTVPMGSLKSALIAFSVKNGTARKTAVSDADMTVDDYLSSVTDNYKFFANMNKTAAPPASPPAAQQPAAMPPPKP